jgi:hypothetical protein
MGYFEDGDVNRLLATLARPVSLICTSVSVEKSLPSTTVRWFTIFVALYSSGQDGAVDVRYSVRNHPRAILTTFSSADVQYRSYMSLTPKTRALLGLGLIANAALALQFSDQTESYLGLQSTAQEQDELKRVLPKVTMVETEKSRSVVEASNR